jgi:hypothetical protein
MKERISEKIIHLKNILLNAKVNKFPYTPYPKDEQFFLIIHPEQYVELLKETKTGMLFASYPNKVTKYFGMIIKQTPLIEDYMIFSRKEIKELYEETKEYCKILSAFSSRIGWAVNHCFEYPIEIDEGED